MMTEDFQEETTSLSVEDATNQLLAASQEQPVEDEEDQVDTDEGEELEVQEDQANDELEEDGTDETDEAEEIEELFFEIDGEEVSLNQIKEWQQGSLRQSDYTKKTQAIAVEREQVKAERAQINDELQALQSERTQLQNALATLAIDADPEPNWVEMAQTKTPQEVLIAQGEYRQRQLEKQKTAQVYQELQRQQAAERQQKEVQAVVKLRPEWATDDGWKAAQSAILSAASAHNISEQELLGPQMDHRSLLVLHELAEVKAKLAQYQKTTAEVKKRVVKAEPKRVAGARPAKNQSASKAAKAKAAKLRTTGKIDDAVDALMAQLNSS